jgi:catechol 2,3-dioxygenase-like lactoylglutathione lyase family enzyme
MSFRLTERKNSVFETKGLSHVALVCADMQRTVDFYQDVLGFPLIKTTELPGGGGQHFFFDMGDGNGALAFFYFPKKHVVEPGVTVPRNNVGDPANAFDHDSYTTAIGSLNHLAFNVAPEKIPEYKQKLESLGIWVSPIMYHFGKDGASIGVAPDEEVWLTSVYFRDPDGIQLEFGAWSRRLTDDDISHKPATRADAPPAFDQRPKAKAALS